MRVGLLGGLEVLDDDDRDVVVAGAKLRALLAVLALHAGRVVPAEQIVDALWGEHPPAAVRNGLQGLASKLRRALGSAELVAMRGGGYALELPAEAIDVHRYEQLVAAGHAAAADGDPGRAVALLGEADSLWRGDPLADFTYEEFAAAHDHPVVRAAARRDRGAARPRARARPSPGGDRPTRSARRARIRCANGFAACSMLALYRAGRQADTLRVFQEGRHILGEELGLEPSHELRQLESAILAQDRSLDSPAVTAPTAIAGRERRSTIPEALTPLVGRDVELRDLMQAGRGASIRDPRRAGRGRQDAARVGSGARACPRGWSSAVPGRAGASRRSGRRSRRDRCGASTFRTRRDWPS